MGLYDKVRARTKAPTASSGLLRRSLSARAAAAQAPAAAPPADRAPQPAAAPPSPDLQSAISRIESGFDAPPLLFEAIAGRLGLGRAALLVADYVRGSFASCASRGLGGGLTLPVTGWVEGLFDGEGVRPLGADQARSLGDLAEGVRDLRVRAYRRGEAPVGILVFAPPERHLDDAAISASLGHEAIAPLLEFVSARLSELPPVAAENLDGVRPAGSSMLLAVSCADVVAALSARTPSMNSAWLTDILQRLLARMLVPLGRVGSRSGNPVAVLTQRSLDAELLAHQISLVLARYIASIRPLPPPVVTSLG